jgi:hypothetical protein
LAADWVSFAKGGGGEPCGPAADDKEVRRASVGQLHLGIGGSGAPIVER